LRLPPVDRCCCAVNPARGSRPWRRTWPANAAGAYEHVVTSRTQARDLLWTFDSVRRLGDAQTGKHFGHESLDDSEYVDPGVLWWAFAPKSARRRGSAQPRSQAIEPNVAINRHRSPDHAVVLIDEIDKAEPDMPNGLLVPLGSSEFVVTETNQVITKEAPAGPIDNRISRHLIMITTNEERELSQAFLRRCVVVWLEQPRGEQLIQIAKAHLAAYDGGYSGADEELMRSLAEILGDLRSTANEQRMRAPSTAEYLDALRACRGLGITVANDNPQWRQLRSLTLLKPQRPEG